MFQHLFSSRRHTFHGSFAKSARPGATARRRSSRPDLETLEDRLTPSTLTVTTSADSGPGSLRAAIASAMSGSTINFASNVSAITLTSGELLISKSLDIEGPGASRLSISGNNASRVFHVVSGSTLTLANLTIAGGQASGPLPTSLVGEFSGGGTIDPPTGAGGGGGILNEHGATLHLTNDTLSNNQALHGPSPLAFTVLGGGVLNLGTASVQGCAFSNNQVSGGNAFDNLGGSAGGAIENFGGPGGAASLTVAGSTFSNNSAVAAGGNFFFGIGGALDNNAGLNGFDPTQAQASTAMCTNCTFLTNLATAGAGAIGNGGAVCSEGVGVIMTLVGCTVSGNRAVGGDGGDGLTTGNSQALGGGICSVDATLNIRGCTITNNLALAGNNAVISDADPFTAIGFGGGIESNFDNVLNISNSLVANNVAQGGATATGPGGDGVGGGISNSPGSTMQMTNCMVTSNSAIAGQGGPGVNSLLVNALGGFAFGGGVETSNGSSATISGSQLIGNSATGGAGGTGNNGGNSYGGGLGIGFATLAGVNPDGAQLTLMNSTVAGNLALGGTGGQGGAGGDGQGGGLCVTATCSAIVTSTSFTNNSAAGGREGAGASTSNGQGIGGGIEDGSAQPGGASLTLTTSRLTSNTAIGGAGASGAGGGAGIGGGLAVENSSTAKVTSTTFTGNSAVGGAGGSGAAGGGGSGGGIAVGGGTAEDTSTLTLGGSTFSLDLAQGGAGGNGAAGGGGYGGALFVGPGTTATINQTSIAANAAQGGSGLGLTGGNGLGGGIDVASGGNVGITASAILQNNAVGGRGKNASSAGQGIGGGVYTLGTFTYIATKQILTPPGKGVYTGGSFSFGPATIILFNYATTSGNNIGP